MADDVIAGRYRLLELIGRGGMSEVWRAQDLELERPVALKLLAPDADRARFDREARAAASLAHPNITQLFDYGEADGRPFMVLEYLPGGTLEQRLTGKPLPDAETDRIAREVAAGLAHAHERGVIHRDLKPANVLFDIEGRAKIADFGIARLSEGGTLTEAGTVLGTAAYISPEQAAGEAAVPASDVYSFGVILYRMLTGRLPFEAAQPMDLVTMHRDETPPPVREIRPDAPGRLEAVATAALAKDPGERPADGAALLAELGGLPTTTTLRPSPDEATQVLAPRPPVRSRRLPTGFLVAALALLGAGGVALAYEVTRPADSAPGTTTSILPSLPTRNTLGTTTTAPTTAPASTAATTRGTTSAATTTHAAPTAPTTTAATTAPASTPTVVPPPPPPATTAPATTAPATTATTTAAGTPAGPQ